MKSKTSCYDPAFSRMELRRFAPVWILYTIGFLLILAMQFSIMSGTVGDKIESVKYCSEIAGVMNAGYALVLAQLFFGDLYSPRLCYAIHSMPVTRGGWFGTQIILGLFSGLLPNCIAAGAFFLMLNQFRQVILWWLAASLLQFMLFYGAAVFCAICAGNRFGMVILYGMLNFAALVYQWIRIKVLAPLIYAMYIPDVDDRLCPIAHISENPLFNVEYEYISYEVTRPDSPSFWQTDIEVKAVHLTGLLGYLVICALVGCAFIWLAMRLYRKRKLECAGDLLAFPRANLPLLLTFSLFAGTVGHLFADAYGGNTVNDYLFLTLGLVVGYYVCLMLLKRQINVVTRKSLLPLGILCGIILLVLTLTGLDVLGITYRVPKAEDVASVSVDLNYFERIPFITSDPQEIEAVIEVQQEALEHHRQAEEQRSFLKRVFGNEGFDPYGDDERTTLLYLIYEMKDGSTMKRCYYYNERSTNAATMRSFFSRPEIVFSNGSRTLLDEDGGSQYLLDNCAALYLNCAHNMNDFGQTRYCAITGKEDLAGFLHAVIADCEAGYMAQSFILHSWDDPVDSIDFSFLPIHRATGDTPFYGRYLDLRLYPECDNAYGWLIEHGYHEPFGGMGE